MRTQKSRISTSTKSSKRKSKNNSELRKELKYYKLRDNIFFIIVCAFIFVLGYAQGQQNIMDKYNVEQVSKVKE